MTYAGLWITCSAGQFRSRYKCVEFIEDAKIGQMCVEVFEGVFYGMITICILPNLGNWIWRGMF